MLKSLSILLVVFTLGACQLNKVMPGSGDEYASNNDDVNHFRIAKQAYSNKNYDLARKEYEIIIKDHPKYIEALFRLGNIAMRDNKLDKAKDYYSRITAIKPSHAQAHHNLAILYLRQANNHLNYYIANDENSDNQAISRLLNALDRYTGSRSSSKSELDELADLVGSE